MNEVLRASELLTGLDEAHCASLLAIAKVQPVDAGEYLFLLGDSCDRLYVVVEGQIDVCFPLSFGGTMKDIAVESKAPGSALGWSAFVKPHRFTLSARAAEPSVVAAFPRQDLLRLMGEDVLFREAFMARITEIVGGRLLKTQALWARELQRSLASGLPALHLGGA